MAIPKWLQKQWDEQRPNLVLIMLGLIGTSIVGLAASVAKGLTTWQLFGVISCMTFLLIWAVAATVIASRPGRLDSKKAVTLENIEERLREWILKFRLGSQKLGDNPAVYHFNYQITGPNKQPINVGRPQALDGYLHFSAGVLVTSKEDEALRQLGETGRKRFIIEYMAGCSKARARITQVHFAPFGAAIERTLPITPNLTGDDFWNTFDLMQQDIAIAAHNVNLCLERAKESQAIGPPRPQPSPSTPDTEASQPSPTS